MQKAQLGTQHPDYHTLLSVMKQILDGLILDAWHLVCGFTSLAKFAKSKPTPDNLFSFTSNILLNHTTPLPSPVDETKQHCNPSKDTVNQNIWLMFHDFLHTIEVVQAISDGDWGRVKDMLPNLAKVQDQKIIAPKYFISFTTSNMFGRGMALRNTCNFGGGSKLMSCSYDSEIV
jgi:hypothetical protein